MIPKWWVGIVLSISLLVFPTMVGAEGESSSESTSDSSLLIDTHTGTILEATNIDEVRGIAQLSKWMTLYIVLQQLEDGQLTKDQTYEVSDYVAAVSEEASFFDIPFEAGTQLSVEQLYDALTITQSTAASVAFAELIDGSEAAFVKRMNEVAKELQLEQTLFTNASGEKGELLIRMGSDIANAESESVGTARSLGELMYYTYQLHPLLGDDMSRMELQWNDMTYENRNSMLEGKLHEISYIDSAMIGESNLAGFSLVASGKRGKQRLIAVLLDSKTDGVRSELARYDIVKQLMDDVFLQYTDLEVVQEGAQIKNYETYPVLRGTKKKVDIIASESIRTLLPNDSEREAHVEVTYSLKEPLKAPVKAGTVVGYAYITYDDKQEYNYIVDKSHYVTLVTAEDVTMTSSFRLFFQGIGVFFKDWWVVTKQFLK